LRKSHRAKVYLWPAICLFLAAGWAWGVSISTQQHRTSSREIGRLSDSLSYFKEVAHGTQFWMDGDFNRALRSFQRADSIRSDMNWSEGMATWIHMAKQDSSTQIFLHQERANEQRKLGNLSKEKAELLGRVDHLETKEDSLRKQLRRRSREAEMLAAQGRSLAENLEEVKNSFGSLVMTKESGVEVHYTGSLKEGMADGYGIGIFVDRGIYEGEWKHNHRHGRGVYTWKNGDWYEGEFRDGFRQGYGIYYFSTGERHEGYWAKDIREGQGKFYTNDGKLFLEGRWENNKYVKGKNGGTAP